jgi:protoheme IX farnesyltransferase
MTTASDARPVLSGTPSTRGWAAVARDYVVLIKPTIILLLLITTVPAMILASDAWPSTWLITATLIGGVLAAGGAGAVNMYIDRDIDNLMARTRSRPIPTGRIPAKHAAILGIAMGISSGIWLTLTVNAFAAVLALGAFLYYVVIYSMWLKRTTVHNTVLGGVAGAAPPLIGWVAVTGEVSWTGILLFLVVFAWQPPHFWALALVLADDYRAASVPMLPVVRSESETKGQTLAWALLTLAVTLALGITAQLSALYFTVAIAGGVGFVLVAWRLFRTPGIKAAPSLFRYSTLYLAVLFAAMALDRLLIG